MTNWNTEDTKEHVFFLLLPDGRYEEVKTRITNDARTLDIKTGRIFRKPKNTTDAMQCAPSNRAVIYNASTFVPEYIILDMYGQDI